MENTADLTHNDKIKWASTALVVLITWFSLVLQFSISIPAYMAKGCSLGSTFIQLLSFYTILSNLLMVICLTTILVAPKTGLGRFFLQRSVLTAVAFYITIVAIIYNTLLRNVIELDGASALANELLHVINPVLFLIYWFAFVPKDGLSYKNVLPWLWFPLIYFVYVLSRGAISGNYPYPFLNVAKSGYPQVMLNALILAPLMWGLGALFILVARSLGSRSK